MRVHELAKELKQSNEELLETLRSLNYEVKAAVSGLSMEQIAAVRRFYAQNKGARTQTAVMEPPKEEKPVEVAPPPPPPAAAPEPVPEPKSEPVAAAVKPEPARKPGEKVRLVVKPPIVVRDFAEALGLKPNQLIAELMGMNIFASINQKLEIKTAQTVAERHGFVLEQERKVAPPVVVVEEKPPEVVAEEQVDSEDDKKLRPPVVCFMGHVDHGKTSLLDRIRNSKVAAGEAGGITQHIGAYTVELPARNKSITFLDTPGHEAFTKMRARGANLTDIAVVVIDAVDGMMPQTKEAIQHVKAAGVKLMIAINKIDLRAANIDRVKTQLQQDGLTPDDWGGDVTCCPVSAMSGDGIDNLLDMISLEADMLDLKANPAREAIGYVIEAQLEAGMGPTASVLVRNGTLKVGDAILCGPHWGKIKALLDNSGKKLKEAGPSRAVKVMGLSGVPEAGAEFVVVESDRVAKQLHEERQAALREETLTTAAPKKLSLEELLQQSGVAEKKHLNLVIKSDVQGSLEAVHYMIGGIKSDKVTAKIILAGIGNISVNDVLLAKASKALIVGFNVGKDNGVNASAKREGVEIKLYSIIYELIDELKALMAGLLDPLIRENVHGAAKVKQVFDLGKKGKVAGCVVTSGKVTSKSRVRVRRKGEVMFEGSIAALKRYQNDANEVRDGQECGIRVDHFTDFLEGDVLEMYDVEKIVQQL
ncbi:MAG TPA: translation initiation factor IF-2 [Kiritimatiellia bacterium]|nr:translation initiation factor IF-2 [Kiritimatiellia bacterium]